MSELVTNSEKGDFMAKENFHDRGIVLNIRDRSLENREDAILDIFIFRLNKVKSLRLAPNQEIRVLPMKTQAYDTIVIGWDGDCGPGFEGYTTVESYPDRDESLIKEMLAQSTIVTGKVTSVKQDRYKRDLNVVFVEGDNQCPFICSSAIASKISVGSEYSFNTFVYIDRNNGMWRGYIAAVEQVEEYPTLPPILEDDSDVPDSLVNSVSGKEDYPTLPPILEDDHPNASTNPETQFVEIPMSLYKSLEDYLQSTDANKVDNLVESVLEEYLKDKLSYPEHTEENETVTELNRLAAELYIE